MTLMIRRLVLLSVLFAAGCGASQDGPTTGPADAVILPSSAVAELLSQCSRDAPEAGREIWTPSWADIAALEAALPAALAASRLGRDLREPTPPEGWRRQYVGYVRGGRRFVYGNFYPSGDDLPAWRTEPIIVCDGGSAFFGVEYDVRAREIVRVDFNGPY